MPLFLIFIIVPLIELMLLIEVGSVIGSAWTFIIIIATALIGTRLVKQQGFQTWGNIQQEMATGQLPAQSLFDGICILISGVLLITPGFITDTIGFLLVTPPFRAMMYQQLGSKIQVRAAGQFQQQGFGQSYEQQGQTYEHEPQSPNDIKQATHQPTTLDGDYKRKD